MFLFKSQKVLTHKQTALIGFVLSVLSLLTSAAVVYLFPYLSQWLSRNGVFSLDVFLLVVFVVVFLALQALILFGFPLFYVQDKKSHMTGFQILLYTVMWSLILVGILSFCFVQLNKQTVGTFPLEDFQVVPEQSVAPESTEVAPQ